MAQAVACADARAFLISPLLRQITGWDKKAEGRDAYAPDEDPEVAPVEMDEATFRWEINADAMAKEKLAEGIRNFDKDHKKLIALIGERMR